jgi:hypothetical protein
MQELSKEILEMKRCLNAADHLTYMTYPLIKDYKLLIQIAKNIYDAMIKGVNIVLEHDRLYKRIDLLPQNFEPRFQIFQRECVRKYNFKGEEVSLIIELKDLLNNHLRSSMVFRRRDEMVIYGENLRIKKLSLPMVKDYLTKAKPFILRVDNIINNVR